MTVNRKPTGTATSIPVGLAYGAVTATVVTLLLSAITAKLIDQELLGWEKAGYAVLLILLVASCLGAMVTAGKVKRQKLLMCLAAGGVYYGILLAATALFFGGQYSGVIETGLLVFCGSMLAAFTGNTGKKTRKPRIHNR